MSKFEEFLTEVRTSGIARNNYFEVEIPLPPKMITNAQELQKIQLFCESTSLPAVNISTNPVRTFGEPREVPYEKMYDNLNMTFYVDNNMMVKYFFDRWANIIQDKNSKIFGYYSDYVAPTMKILVLDRSNSGRYLVTLHECYPKSIGEVQLSQNDRDVMRVPVSFAYKYWESEQLSNASVPNETNRIPDDYFRDFDTFQTTNTNILGGISANVRNAVEEIPNKLKIGDNLNNDFGLINL